MIRMSKALLTTIVLLSFGCGGGGGGGGDSSPVPQSTAVTDAQDDAVNSGSVFDINGSVGDGPIVGADITVYDAAGVLIASGVSDDEANYVVEIPEDTLLPVMVRASGGTDLVTQRPADFELVSTVLQTGQQTVNISPLTTLVSKAMACSGGASKAKMDALWGAVENELNIGLDEGVFKNPLDVAISPNNVATAVLANEAVGELIRRTSIEVADVSPDQVVDVLACELADGLFDGQSVQSSVDDSERVLAVAKAAEVGVRLEVLAGRLEVDGADATAAMDAAIATIMPQASGISVSSVRANQQHIDGAMNAISVVQGIFEDEELFELNRLLVNATPANVQQQVHVMLNARVHNTLYGLPQRLALSDQAAIDDVVWRSVSQANASVPVVNFYAAHDTIVSNATATLSWSVTGADVCYGDGAWAGKKALEDSYVTPPMITSAEFYLVCSGLGGVVQKGVEVNVVAAPDVIDSPPINDPSTEPNPASEPVSDRELGPELQPAEEQRPVDEEMSVSEPVTHPVSHEPLSALVQQDSGIDGLVFLEAEAADDSVQVGSHAWTEVASVGLSGLGMKAGPDNLTLIDVGYAQRSPRLDFYVEFVKTGTHSVWIRGLGATSKDDSLHVGINGNEVETADRITGFSDQPGWSNTTMDGVRATIEVPSTGVHIVNVWMREDGFTLDSLALTTNADLVPEDGRFEPESVAPVSETVPAAVQEPESTTAPEPQPAPMLALTSSVDTVDVGGNVTLMWETTNADTCRASGGWSGDRAVADEYEVRDLRSRETFTLTCSGAGGSATAMVSVAVNGLLEVSWIPPTKREDGTNLEAVRSYRIHIGSHSRRYDSVVEVPGNISSYAFSVIAGEYYVAMSSVDLAGVESALSSEARKQTL